MNKKPFSNSRVFYSVFFIPYSVLAAFEPHVHYYLPPVFSLKLRLAEYAFPHQTGLMIRDMASWRVVAFLNTPRTAEVMVLDPGFFAPRMVMHKCSA